jgi:hypothetical protein
VASNYSPPNYRLPGNWDYRLCIFLNSFSCHPSPRSLVGAHWQPSAESKLRLSPSVFLVLPYMGTERSRLKVK